MENPMAHSEPLFKNPAESAPAKPATKRLVVYTIIDRPGTDKSLWWRIGSAWINRDLSINIQLDAFPVNGKLHVREASDKPAELKPVP
jgi:hypothetical protein